MNQSERTQAAVRHVLARIMTLERQLSGHERSKATKDLAIMRRSLGSAPGSQPQAWALAFEGCPEELLGFGEEPSHEERAIYLVLSLYAAHRQGQSSAVHSKDGFSLGEAMRVVALDRDSADPKMPQSFAALVTCSSYDEMSYHLRQSITRIKAVGARLDYGRLTRQVLDFQNPYRRDGVRLEWSRDYARIRRKKDDKQSEQDD